MINAICSFIMRHPIISGVILRFAAGYVYDQRNPKPPYVVEGGTVE